MEHPLSRCCECLKCYHSAGSVGARSESWASSFVASFVRFLQKLNHRGGRNNPRGFVMSQRLKFLVASRQEFRGARFGLREQLAVLGGPRDLAGGSGLLVDCESSKARAQ